ncbi:conserved hypothetical protein [Theileria equi strain WA]|uniref:Uncharacterized protein n=1 Tax=Theileria equi strain WA TaxID=1537102 RepID=L1LFP1_THEEQ|nr:conserved hypothetical protein [Theileria equi strain WA]EKX74075.1 conserved hypothetical protein [Theileria equi strain WA]|eukprot:XP_004833527.1 conserved hypothetical protein [Theileria equi strain WA]
MAAYNVAQDRKSRKEQFDRLIHYFSGNFIVVRTLSHAKEKISGLFQPVDVLSSILLKDENSSGFTFEDYEHLTKLKENDFDYHLLEALVANEPKEDDLESDAPITRWFIEWSVQLVKLVRVSRHVQYDVPLETTGLFLIAHPDDSEVVSSILQNAPTFPIALLFIGDSLDPEKLKEIQANASKSLILDTSECSDVDALCQNGSKLHEFTIDFVKHCLEKLNYTHSDVEKIKKKTSKSPQSDESTRRTLYILMSEELHHGLQTVTSNMCRTYTDHDIQALAHVYSGILQYKRMKQQIKGESHHGDLDNIIFDFDKAASLYLKFGKKWESLLISIFSLFVEDDTEVTKFATKNASFELKTKSDHARSALSLELCSLHSEKKRKRMFQMVMAGHMYNQAGLYNLSKRCYLLAVPEYEEKGWNVSYEHLFGALGRYNAQYFVNALNGLSNVCESKLFANYEHFGDIQSVESLKSQQYAGDREISYLRRLMKVSFMVSSGKSKTKLRISSSSSAFPGLTIEGSIVPSIEQNGSLPFPVRVPLILLKSREGVPGRNCFLLSFKLLRVLGNPKDHDYTSYNERYLEEEYMNKCIEKLASEHEEWKLCLDFTRSLDRASFKRSTKQNTLPRTIRKDSPILLQLEFVNPLHIPLHCDEFYILIGSESESWWEKVQVLSYSSDDSLKEYAFVYLKELEKQILYMQFKISRCGSFVIKGVRWKLFSSANFWVPLYLSGGKVTIKTDTTVLKSQPLCDYLNGRRKNYGLHFKISEKQPIVSVEFYRRNPSDYFTSFDKREDFDIYDKEFLKAIKLSEGKEFCEALDSEQLVRTNDPLEEYDPLLCIVRCISGEFVFTELNIKNKGSYPISTITIKMTSVGIFKLPMYPIGFRIVSNNAKSLWNVTQGHTIKIRENVLDEKTFDVVISGDGPLLNPDETASVFFFMIPNLVGDSDICCVSGHVSITSEGDNVETIVVFKQFYLLSDGVVVLANADHPLSKVIKCNIKNHSDKDITSLTFYNDDKILEPVISPVRVLNTKLDIEKTIVIKKKTSTSTLLPYNDKFTSFVVKWNSGNVFGFEYPAISIPTYAKLVVDVKADLNVIQWEGKPLVVNINFGITNISKEAFESCYAKVPLFNTREDCHKWFFVGTTKRKIPATQPGETQNIAFSALIPLPGVYIFTASDLSFTGTIQPVTIPSRQQTIVVNN